MTTKNKNESRTNQKRIIFSKLWAEEKNAADKDDRKTKHQNDKTWTNFTRTTTRDGCHSTFQQNRRTVLDTQRAHTTFCQGLDTRVNRKNLQESCRNFKPWRQNGISEIKKNVKSEECVCGCESLQTMNTKRQEKVQNLHQNGRCCRVVVIVE